VQNALGKKYNRESCDKIKTKFEDEDIVNIRQLVKVVKAGAISREELVDIFREGFSGLIAVRCVEALYHIVDHPTLSVHKALMATDESTRDRKYVGMVPGSSNEKDRLIRDQQVSKGNNSGPSQWAGAAIVGAAKNELGLRGVSGNEVTYDNGDNKIGRKTCKRLNICFDFVNEKGGCRRGDKCKFIHTTDIDGIEEVEDSSGPMNFCFQFKKFGYCRLGNRCQYEHLTTEQLGKSLVVTEGSNEDDNSKKMSKAFKSEEPAVEVSWSGLVDFEGRKQGTGRYEDSAGHVYEGDYVDGLKEGFGRLTAEAEGYSYEGSWRRDKMDGSGKLADKKHGTVYEGSFANDVKEGEGVKRYSDGASFTGLFRGDAPFSGRLARADGSTEYLAAGQDFKMIYKEPDTTPATFASIAAVGTGTSSTDGSAGVGVRAGGAAGRDLAGTIRKKKDPLKDICYDLVNRGKCAKGNSCKFSHDIAAAAQAQKIQAANNEAAVVFPGSTLQSIEAVKAAEKKKDRKKKSKVCYDYLKGVCSRGDQCIFEHEANVSQMPLSPPVIGNPNMMAAAATTAGAGAGAGAGAAPGLGVGVGAGFADFGFSGSGGDSGESLLSMGSILGGSNALMVPSGALDYSGTMQGAHEVGGQSMQDVVGADLFESLVGGLLGPK
jgi:hypothetical protein